MQMVISRITKAAFEIKMKKVNRKKKTKITFDMRLALDRCCTVCQAEAEVGKVDRG